MINFTLTELQEMLSAAEDQSFRYNWVKGEIEHIQMLIADIENKMDQVGSVNERFELFQAKKQLIG